MENSIDQKRANFSCSGQERANVTQSFKGENKGQNWFFRQFNNQTSHDDYSYVDSDFATAVAAAAFSIHYQYQRIERGGLNKSTITRKQDSFRPPELARGEAATKSPAQNVRVNPSLATRQSMETEADAWEKKEMAKIKSRYDKMNCKILQWENEKKTRAKHRMERKKSEMEQIRLVDMQQHKEKLGRIDRIARGAKAQAEESRKVEESKVKERAKKIRSTGKIPVCCFCF